MEVSDKIILVCSHSRFAKATLLKVCDAGAVDCIITDHGVTDEVIAHYAHGNVKILRSCDIKGQVSILPWSLRRTCHSHNQIIYTVWSQVTNYCCRFHSILRWIIISLRKVYSSSNSLYSEPLESEELNTRNFPGSALYLSDVWYFSISIVISMLTLGDLQWVLYFGGSILILNRNEFLTRNRMVTENLHFLVTPPDIQRAISETRKFRNSALINYWFSAFHPALYNPEAFSLQKIIKSAWQASQPVRRTLLPFQRKR